MHALLRYSAAERTSLGCQRTLQRAHPPELPLPNFAGLRCEVPPAALAYPRSCRSRAPRGKQAKAGPAAARAGSAVKDKRNAKPREGSVPANDQSRGRSPVDIPDFDASEFRVAEPNLPGDLDMIRQ